MPTFSTAATSLKYASGSSWTSGKARQGVYSSTRYEGAIRFANLTGMSFSNVGISQIQLKVTFGTAGGSSNKYLTLYKAAKNDISGSIASMRGSSIGAITVSNAYNRTVTLTFNSSTNSAIYNTLKSYFSAGNQTLIIYVPSTRGTYDGGYCYDYLSVTAATLTFTYEYLQSDGKLVSTTIAAGTAAQLNITAYNPAYTHIVTWSFGNYSTIQTIPAGTASATYTIPLSWLDAIPSATSGSGTVSLETVDTGGVNLGIYIYPFTVTVPASVVPSITSVTSEPVNTNSVLNSWGIYVYGKSQARITINGAVGKYGSTIKSYSITTDPSIGSGSSSTLTTSTLYKTGTVTITATVTDSRGRTATKSTTISIYPYSAPYFTETVAYRGNSSGTRDDTNGTYAYIKASFTRYALSGSNMVSASMTLTQIGGSYSITRTLTSGIGIVVGDGNLAVDATYQVTLTVTDTVGSSAVYRIEINSAAYIIHVKKGGKAIGFGMAAGSDNTVSFGWPIKLSYPLEISQGGTGASSAASALSALGAAASSHTHTPSAIGAAAVSHSHTLTDLSGTLSVAKGGTGATTAKAALNSLGVFYADTLPDTGTDGQICLVLVS